MERAYSVLTVKSMDDDERIIEGIATTPSTDRMGDVVEPLGIKYKNPLPLLWQHQHDKPVGMVEFDKPTAKGVTFRAKLAKVDEPGALKDRIDEAWQSVKAKLVRGVSIGFRSMESAYIQGGGVRFLKSEVLELSLVTVPANSDATIQMIKSIDSQLLAASGRSQKGVPVVTVPGAAGNPKSPQSKGNTMNIAEQIASFEAKRAATAARMEEIMSKSADEGRTLDESESEEHQNLTAEVKSVDAHLTRLREMETLNIAKAAPVAGTAAAPATAARSPSVISVTRNLPKGTGFTRYAMALARAKGNLMQAVEIAKGWRDSTPEVERVLKAAVDAGTTTDSTWAAPLVDYQTLASEFIELLRPQTIIGRLPQLRRIPFNVRMPRQTAGGTYGWVGEGKAKPVGELAFDEITMRWAKAAGIIVITDELARQSNPAAEAIVRDDMINGIAQFLDQQFTDPNVAEVANVSPAAITNGVSNAVAATGTSAEAFRTDVGTMWATMLNNNINVSSGIFVMSNTMAMRLSLMQNPLGQSEFPSITASGGTLLGYPVVTSESVVPPDTDGDMIIFLTQRDVFLSEDSLMLDVSREATLQFNTAPDEPTSASTVLVSLWQRNMIGLRAERFVNWKRRRDAAVGYIYAANYTVGS